MKPKRHRATTEYGNTAMGPEAVMFAMFPGGWVGAMGAILLMCAVAVLVCLFLAPPLPPDAPPQPLKVASYVAFDGSVRGGAAEIAAIDGPSVRRVVMVAARDYKVHVVYRSSGPGGIHYVRTMMGSGGSGRYGGSWRWAIQGVGGDSAMGPAIICIGVNRYAVLGAPRTGHDGTSGAGMNTIHFGDDQFSDISLYSTDCKTPDAAAIDRLARAVGMTLPR